MKAALAFEEHDEILRNFALEKFKERYSDEEFAFTVWYNGYEVLDENTLIVKYQYGGGDMEMDGYFKVTIEDENR